MSWVSLLSDILFPPSEQERIVRALTNHDLSLLRTVPHSHDIEHLFRYSHDKIRALIWQLKYKRDPRAIHLLAYALRQRLAELPPTPHILIAIPLSTRRTRHRGYNQVELVIAEAITPLSHHTLLTQSLARTRDTTPQTRLSRYERLKNLKGAFAVTDATRIQDRTILLIDDVTTTGTTFREARETLLAAGARDVHCIAFAH